MCRFKFEMILKFDLLTTEIFGGLLKCVFWYIYFCHALTNKQTVMKLIQNAFFAHYHNEQYVLKENYRTRIA